VLDPDYHEMLSDTERESRGTGSAASIFMALSHGGNVGPEAVAVCGRKPKQPALAQYLTLGSYARWLVRPCSGARIS
jgi:hypothetical protein